MNPIFYGAEPGALREEWIEAGPTDRFISGIPTLTVTDSGGRCTFQQHERNGFSICWCSGSFLQPVRLHLDQPTETIRGIFTINNHLQIFSEGSQILRMEPSSLLMLPAGIDHELIEMEPGLFSWFGFDWPRAWAMELFSAIDDEPLESNSLEAAASFFGIGRAAGIALHRLVSDFPDLPLKGKRQDYFFRLRMQESLLLFLHYLQSSDATHDPHREEEQDAIHRIGALLEQHVAQRFPLRQLARQTAMNEMKLKTLFRKIYGQGIFEFQLSARMREAHRLLEEGSLSTKQIAAKVGYALTTSFITKFREYFGYPPGRISRRKK